MLFLVKMIEFPFYSCDYTLPHVLDQFTGQLSYSQLLGNLVDVYHRVSANAR